MHFGLGGDDDDDCQLLGMFLFHALGPTSKKVLCFMWKSILPL